LWPLYKIVKNSHTPIITRSINFEPLHFLEEDGYSFLNILVNNLKDQEPEIITKIEKYLIQFTSLNKILNTKINKNNINFGIRLFKLKAYFFEKEDEISEFINTIFPIGRMDLVVQLPKDFL